MAKNNNEENNNKRRTYKQLKPVSLLSGVEEIRNDFEERLEQGTVNYGIEILDDYVNTIRKGSLTFILARPNCLALKEEILTNRGFKKVSDLTANDKVIGIDGREYNILSFTEYKDVCYELEVSDGRTVTSSASHEWLVNNIKRKTSKLYTSEQLFDYSKKHPIEFKHMSLPIGNANQFNLENTELPIHPYLLGVLIGDGCCKYDCKITKPNVELFNKIKAIVPTAEFNGIDISLKDRGKIKSLIKTLQLNVNSYDKFIPKEYLNAGLSIRAELLQGLLDTDGYQQKSHNEYSTTSKQLAKDIQRLAWSLGYRCTIKSRMGHYTKKGVRINTRENYRVLISNTRTKAQCVLKSIKKVDVQKTRCITTDAPDNLIYATNYIVTRNTGKSLLGQQIACHLATQGKRVCICSCEMGSGLLMERQIRKTLGIGMGDLYTTYKNHRDMGNQLLDKLIEDDKYDYLRNIDVCETGGASVYDIIDMLECFTEYEYIVIDYIQRIKGGGSEYENITESARELQTYARRTGKPLIVCSQAKRQPTNEKFDPTNAGSAGKGSGSIEEDGDVGILLSELYEDGAKKILATLFKNRFEGGKNITYKYRLDNRLNMILEQKDYDFVQ